MAVARARHGACAGHAPDPLRLDGSPAWHFRMLATYGVLGAVVGFAASLARQAGGDPAAIEGWFLLGGTIITVFKIAWFWGAARHHRAFPERLFGTRAGHPPARSGGGAAISPDRCRDRDLVRRQRRRG